MGKIDISCYTLTRSNRDIGIPVIFEETTVKKEVFRNHIRFFLFNIDARLQNRYK